MTRIIIDSTIDLPEQYRRQVHIVPLTIHFGTEELLDGVDIDRQRFYERLVESDVLPTTSQPSPDAFAQLFEQVEAAGDSAVVLTISHKLSGTYQSACIAAEGRERIFVVDTMSASIGSGILARYAIDNAHLHAGELAALLERRRQDVCIIGLVDTLEYLKKGGRISKTAAFAGGLLNIHPVLTLTDGEVTIIGKARGSRQGNNLLVQKIHESGGIDFSMPLLLGYSGSATPCCKSMWPTAPLCGKTARRRWSPCASAASSAPTPVQAPWWRPSSGGEENNRKAPPSPLGRAGLCFGSRNKNQAEKQLLLRLIFLFRPLGGPLHHMTGDAGGEPPQGVGQPIIHRYLHLPRCPPVVRRRLHPGIGELLCPHRQQGIPVYLRRMGRQPVQRHQKRLPHLGGVQPQPLQRRRGHLSQHRVHQGLGAQVQEVRPAQQPDVLRGDAQLLPRFPQGTLLRSLPRLHAPTGEADLPAVVVQGRGAHLIQQAQTLRRLRHRHQHGIGGGGPQQARHMAGKGRLQLFQLYGTSLLSCRHQCYLL